MVVHLPAGTLGQPHVVLIKLKYPEVAEVIAQVEIKINLDEVPGANPGEGINVPQVIDLTPIVFRTPARSTCRSRSTTSPVAT